MKLDSHYLAYLLRHHPEERGLKLDEFGWCSIEELLKALEVTRKELEACVKSNTRFIYSSDKKFIKAAHGHSVPIKYINDRKPPKYLYHGTSNGVKELILAQGLKKMNRECVHLSENFDDAFKIGLRHTCGDSNKVIVFTIKAVDMYIEGYKFYRSEDGVWLVNEVPSKYLY